jgi:hypothetical protein
MRVKVHRVLGTRSSFISKPLSTNAIPYGVNVANTTGANGEIKKPPTCNPAPAGSSEHHSSLPYRLSPGATNHLLDNLLLSQPHSDSLRIMPRASLVHPCL